MLEDDTFNEAFERLGGFAVAYDLIDFDLDQTFSELELDRAQISSWADSLRAMRAIDFGIPLEDAGAFDPIDPPDPDHERQINALLSERQNLGLIVLWGLALASDLMDVARQCYEDGDTPSAIINFYYAGMFKGQAQEHLEVKLGRALAIKQMAIKGATAAHAENRAAKSDALAYFRDNIEQFSSLDDAAEKIAGTVVPFKFRTVRDWLKGQELPRRQGIPPEPK